MPKPYYDTAAQSSYNKSSGGYLMSALVGAAVGALAVAIPLGLGMGAVAVTTAVAGAGSTMAAGVVGGGLGAYASVISAALVCGGLFAASFLKKNLDGFDSIKFSTLVPSLIASAALTACAMTGQFSSAPAADTKPVKTSFNSSAGKIYETAASTPVTVQAKAPAARI